MTEPSHWPAYPVGPKDSIFAIGVVSIKFAELERALHFLFGTVFGIGMDGTKTIVAKVGSATCSQILSLQLPTVEWPTQYRADVDYFISAFDICLENRNQLIHSQISVLSSDHTILSKLSKKGTSIMAAPKLAELRRVADDINTYCIYGRALGNSINLASASTPPAFAFPWPSRPPLPHKMNYSSEPLRLT
jgi:hypothetical protein